MWMKLRLLPEIALDAHNAPGLVKGDPEKGEQVLQKYIFYHDIGEDEKKLAGSLFGIPCRYTSSLENSKYPKSMAAAAEN
tara:strand:+ start:52 stop:291 length:240 start_codon:yes stop_codon:yes gene_type:complete